MKCCAARLPRSHCLIHTTHHHIIKDKWKTHSTQSKRSYCHGIVPPIVIPLPNQTDSVLAVATVAAFAPISAVAAVVTIATLLLTMNVIRGCQHKVRRNSAWLFLCCLNAYFQKPHPPEQLRQSYCSCLAENNKSQQRTWLDGEKMILPFFIMFWLWILQRNVQLHPHQNFFLLNKIWSGCLYPAEVNDRSQHGM